MTNIINSNIEEVKIIEPSIFEDTRGYFFESYNQEKWTELGLGVKFIQDNELSKNGVINEGIVSTRLGLKGISGKAEQIILGGSLQERS